MKVLFILNGPRYGGEESHNALRLAGSLVGCHDHAVRVFLLGEGVAITEVCHHLEWMLRAAVLRGAEVTACGSGMDAGRIPEIEPGGGIRRGTLEELTKWTREADQVLVF